MSIILPPPAFVLMYIVLPVVVLLLAHRAWLPSWRQASGSRAKSRMLFVLFMLLLSYWFVGVDLLVGIALKIFPELIA